MSKNLTEYFNSGKMFTAIENGTFKNIKPGDHIIKPIIINGITKNVKWIIGSFDKY